MDYGPCQQPIPQPHQNWSQHARLLPYLEQQVALQRDQLVASALAGVTATPCIPITNPPDDADGGSDSIPQMTVLVTTDHRVPVPVG